MNFFAASEVDERRCGLHLVLVDEIGVFLGVYCDEPPLVGMVIGQRVEVGTQRAARLTPRPPKIDDDAARLLEKYPVELRDAADFLDWHWLADFFLAVAQSSGYSDSWLDCMFIVMLNLLPQLKIEQAKTISTISSSLKCPFSDRRTRR